MGNKERPNKLIRDYGRATKAGVVFVKKRNPTLSTSQWKKRALGLYGTQLVFSEVGAEDAVKEDDKSTEELDLPRSAQVVIHSVLGVACVCVETAKHPLIFRPLDERQSHQLDEWMNVIRTAVTPLKLGSLDPLGELEVLMKRKDLTPVEAQRAQMLMKDHGMIHKQEGLVNRVPHVAMEACTPSPSHRKQPPLASDAITTRIGGSEWTTGASLFEAKPSPITVPHALAVEPPAEKLESEVDITPTSMSQSMFRQINPVGRGGSHPTTTSVFMGSLAASYPEAQAAFCTLHADERAWMSNTRPMNPPPGVEVLSAVRDGDGHYEGYIAANGTCVDVHGICVGYLNDVERTAGSPKGEYLGCVTEPRNGEAMIERPDGTQLAVLDLGRTQLKTRSGSTVAEFKMSGEVIANLGHTVCSFDALSFHDQPTMALYLSFINSSLLTKAALIQSSAHQSFPPCVNPANHGASASPITPSPCTSFTRPSADVISDVISHDAPLSHSNERRCLADFLSSEPWQLSAKAGDTFLVVETHDDGWAACLDATGRRGMLPSAYFEVVSAPTLATSRPMLDVPCVPLSRSITLSSPSASDCQRKLRLTRKGSVLPPPPEPAPSFSPFALGTPESCPERNTEQCAAGKSISHASHRIAISSFEADGTQHWQVSLDLDEICHIVEDHGDGWASIVKAGGDEGVVPLAFLAPINRKIDSFLTHSQPLLIPPRRGTHRALHHFSASDLSWQIGVDTDDEVELREEFDDGWSSIVQLKSGKSGLVPSGFLAPKIPL